MWDRSEVQVTVKQTPLLDHPIVAKLAVAACFAFTLWIMAGRPWF